MRTFEDLNDIDKGAFIVREEIKKTLNYIVRTFERRKREIPYGDYMAYNNCIDICNECLDTETLGDIE